MFKVKQKITKILVACLTALFAVVLAIGGIFAMPNTTVHAADPITQTLSIYGTTGTQASDSSSISWTSGAVTFTNYKASSTSNILATDSSYYRVYANSIVEIKASKATISQIVITCTSSSYATACKDSAVKVEGATVSVSSSVVTITLSPEVEPFTFTASKQIRLNKVEVTYTPTEDSGSDEPACEYNLTYSYPTNVTFSGEETTISVEEGTKINLPTTTAPDGYVFAGWSEEEITEATTTKPTLYTDTYTVTEETTLYAVYHNDVEEGGWNLVTDANELATDDIVTIVCPTKNVAIGTKSNTSTVYFTKIDITSADTILTSNTPLTELTVTKNTDGQFAFKTESNYLSWSSGNSLTTNSSEYYWTVAISNPESATTTTTIKSVNTPERNLQYNASSPRFACYTTVQTAVCLYKYKEGGEISYTSVFCDHSGEKTIVTEDATCTQDGSTTVTCNDCGMEISHETITATGHVNQTTTTVDATCTENGSITVTCDDCGETISTETIDATGHSLDEGVITTEPQAGVEGVKTYTCQNGCGYTETESIPALDATKYTLSYSVSGGVDAPASVELANNESTVLPSVDAPANFVFVGWVTEECKETQSAPETIYEANSEYTLSVEENVTLYALFTYSTGSGNFVKVTEAPADWSGEYLIVYEDGNVAFNSNLEVLDATSNTVNVTIENDVIGYNDVLNNAVFTIALIDGSNYSIKATSGKYIGRSSNSNGLDSGNTAVSNTLSIDADGNAVITAAGNTTLRFNKASNQMRFRYYKSGQEAIALYALDSKTYYATDLSVKIESATITIGTDLKVNYYVSMPAEYENATMSFTVNGADGFNYVTEGTKVGEYYVFTVKVGPHQMAENISATLYFGETVLAAMENYSIKTYAQNKLNDPASSDALKQLLTDLLVYGDAAYNYKYETTGETPATSGVANIGTASTATPNNEVDNKFALSTNEEAGSYPVYFKSVTVWFGDTNKIRAALVLTEGVDASKITVTINGVDATVSGSYIYTDAILATGFDTIYTFVLSYDGVVMQTLTYSVNSYAYKMKANAEMSELALALYRYGVSAKAYIG